MTTDNIKTDNIEEVSMEDAMGTIEKSMVRINSGDIVRGTVISVSENEVLVNIGFITDGVRYRYLYCATFAGT